jgi:hypothetical protein
VPEGKHRQRKVPRRHTEDSELGHANQ